MARPSTAERNFADAFWACRNHDAFMLDKSKVPRVMRRISRKLGKNYQLFGDPAYPQSLWIGGPFRHRMLNREEAEFNAIMSSTRISNEWVFAKIKSLWAYLDFEKGMRPYTQDVQKLWSVAQILTNCHTCLYGSEMNRYFKVNSPDLEAYLTNRV